MTTAWVLNAVGLFTVTAGALLMFLALRKAPKSVPESPTPDDRRAYEKQRRLTTVATGLIAAWLVIQYVGLLI